MFVLFVRLVAKINISYFKKREIDRKINDLFKNYNEINFSTCLTPVLTFLSFQKTMVCSWTS
ncbi:hypothetical protein HMPREF6745_3039 [Prevotella sp. oral taxon 472 str. F0295]|nr:hypothetical protein HMPREF6745_3039 [Prevotella sp. oral taxon 472 str. F0295]